MAPPENSRPKAKGLERKLKRSKLDIHRGWTPAISLPTDKGCGLDKVYVRGKPSDHKAQEVVIELDIAETDREGDKAMIKYNNREGWLNYRKLSDKVTRGQMPPGAVVSGSWGEGCYPGWRCWLISYMSE